jgi:hypothetical protein
VPRTVPHPTLFLFNHFTLLAHLFTRIPSQHPLPHQPILTHSLPGLLSLLPSQTITNERPNYRDTTLRCSAAPGREASSDALTWTAAIVRARLASCSRCLGVGTSDDALAAKSAGPVPLVTQDVSDENLRTRNPGMSVDAYVPCVVLLLLVARPSFSRAFP